ncbi:MAG: hypothetical protein ABL957_10605 [Parvularculaceae bacterium]
MSKQTTDAAPDDAELRQLLAELEATLDAEPQGLNFAELAEDARLQSLAIQLWKDVQTRSAISKQNFEEALKKEDLTPADLWAPGMTERLEVSSTRAEIDRFKTKLKFRSDVLQVLLEETMADLEKAENWIASDEASVPEGDGAPRH